MAQNPPCMIEGCETPSTFTGTFFSNGQSITVCEEHFVAFAGGTLEAMTGVPVLDIIATSAAGGEAEAEGPTDEAGETGPTSSESSDPGTASDHDETASDAEAAAQADHLEVVTPDAELDTLTHQ